MIASLMLIFFAVMDLPPEPIEAARPAMRYLHRIERQPWRRKP